MMRRPSMMAFVAMLLALAFGNRVDSAPNYSLDIVFHGEQITLPQPILPDPKDCTDRRTELPNLRAQAKVAFASKDVVALDIQMPAFRSDIEGAYVYVAMDDRRPVFLSFPSQGNRTLLFDNLDHGKHRVVFATIGVSLEREAQQIDDFPVCFIVPNPMGSPPSTRL
jgi:hypothetical protein